MLHTILAGSKTTIAQPSFVSASSVIGGGTTGTVTAPSGIQNGDLLVAVGVSYQAAFTGLSVPSGFNLISTQASTSGHFIAAKVANSESGNYAFSWTQPTASVALSILVYRNAAKINTVGTVGYVGGGSGAVNAPAITPSYVGTLIGVHFGQPLSSIPSGMTSRVQTTAVYQLNVCDLAAQLATSTGTKTFTAASPFTYSNSAILYQITNEPDVTPTFIASANTQNPSGATTLVINKPTGTANGDLMVAVMAAAAGITWSGDTGWTEAADQGATPGLRVAYKIAGSSEPSSYTFTSNATAALSGCILTYRYAAYDTIAGSFTTAANPLLLSSISPTLSQSILIAAGARAVANTTLGTPTSMTARVTDADATTPSYIVCDQFVAKGPTGTRSMSTGSTTSVSGIMLAIKPTRSL